MRPWPPRPRIQCLIVATWIVTLTTVIALPDWPFLDRSNALHRWLLGITFGGAIGAVCMFLLPRTPRLCARFIWRASAVVHQRPRRPFWTAAVLVGLAAASVLAVYFSASAETTHQAGPPTVVAAAVPGVDRPHPRVTPRRSAGTEPGRSRERSGTDGREAPRASHAGHPPATPDEPAASPTGDEQTRPSKKAKATTPPTAPGSDAANCAIITLRTALRLHLECL